MGSGVKRFANDRGQFLDWTNLNLRPTHTCLTVLILGFDDDGVISLPIVTLHKLLC